MTELQDRNVVVIGAGAMGALFGAILQDGGLRVALVDTNDDHVRAIRGDGLSITGYGGERTVRIPATTDAAEIPSAEIVLFHCKGHGTRAAARSARHLFAGGAVAISFQNGLGNEEVITEELGQGRVLGGLTAMAGHMLGPGRIRDFSRVPSYIGEMEGGLSDRTQAIAKRLTDSGLETHPTGDVKQAIWQKLLGNIAMSAVSGATDLTSVQALAVPELKSTCLKALDEALSVSKAEGLDLDRDDVIAGLELITAPGGTGDNKSSLCVDILNRRPTEVDFIYGSVIERARAAGIAVPTLDTLAAIVKGLESGYLGGRS